MIFYNNLLAKWFLRKGKKHCFMLGGLFFTRYKYLEIWEDMEVRIHARQFWECFFQPIKYVIGNERNYHPPPRKPQRQN